MATAKTSGICSDIVTLADLTPTQDVKGGARRRVFGEETPLEEKERRMDTRKKQSEQRKSTGPTSAQKPLKLKKDTLKDLGPDTRNAQHVKGGGVPKEPIKS